MFRFLFKKAKIAKFYRVFLHLKIGAVLFRFAGCSAFFSKKAGML